MFVFGILILVILLGIVPIAIGGIPAKYVDKKSNSIPFMWMSGFLLMWAGFQFICVPLIITEGVGEAHFPYVVWVFTFYLVICSLLGVWTRVREERNALRLVSEHSKWEKICWSVALVLIALQAILSVVLVYADGDDAYYVAVSTLAESSNTMYKASPYSVGYMGLDVRHGLAPLPIWVAYLARMSGCNAALVAHSVVAPTLILLTYAIYYLIGVELFQKQKGEVPLFLCVVSICVIFGNYSRYTAESFMLTRSRQGKAALGNVILPVVIYLCILLLKKVQADKRAERVLYILLFCAVTGACLCTTLGAFLVCLLIGVIGICAAISFRKWSILWKWGLCCSPAIFFAAIYFLMG